jgi:hypothetical protein
VEAFQQRRKSTQKTSFRDKGGRRGEGGITREKSQRTRNRHSRYDKENSGMERRQSAGWSGCSVGSVAVSRLPLSFEYLRSFILRVRKCYMFVHADCAYSCEPSLQLFTVISASVWGLSNQKILTVDPEEIRSQDCYLTRIFVKTSLIPGCFIIDLLSHGRDLVEIFYGFQHIYKSGSPLWSSGQSS